MSAERERIQEKNKTKSKKMPARLGAFNLDVFETARIIEVLLKIRKCTCLSQILQERFIEKASFIQPTKPLKHWLGYSKAE